jgi:hypothetical protein
MEASTGRQAQTEGHLVDLLDDLIAPIEMWTELATRHGTQRGQQVLRTRNQTQSPTLKETVR